MKSFVKINLIVLNILFVFLFFNDHITKYAFADSKTNYESEKGSEQFTDSEEDTQYKNEEKLFTDNNKDLVHEEEINKNEIYTIHNKIFYTGNKQIKQVALTFDDGPSKYYTDKVIDILKENNVKGTFYLIGRHIERYPEIVKRIAQEGHEIGNHSWSHRNFRNLTKEQIREELNRTEEILDATVGKHSNIFRPPYGSIGQKSLWAVNDSGYNVVNWSVDTRDWAGTTVEQIMVNVRKQMYSGGIILMHCSGSKKAMENMVTALPQIIKLAKEQGYEFATTSQLLNLEKKE